MNQLLRPLLPIHGAYALVNDERYIHFCSQDYLGLSDHPEVKKNAIKYLLQYGLGRCLIDPSRFYFECEKRLEKKLATLLGQEIIRFFPSRSYANEMTLSALSQENCTIFIDETSHENLFHGAKKGRAHVVTYSQKDLKTLEEIAKNTTSERKVIVAESISSQTGELCNLSTLITLAKHFEALLYIDDSHALGTLGKEGMGLAARIQEIDIISGSLSKACGVYGGFIATSQKLKSLDIKGTVLLPATIMGAVDLALDLIGQMEGERKQLQQRVHYLRKQLREYKAKVITSTSPLISLLFDSEEELQGFLKILESSKILVRTDHAKRLNLFITSAHTLEHLNAFLEAFKEWQTSSLSIAKRTFD